MGDDSVLFVVSSKSRINAEEIYSGEASLQLMLGGASDDLLQRGARSHRFQAEVEVCPEPTNQSEGIVIGEREVMLKFSSTLPFEISHVSVGSGSCLILGHLSEESIECLMKMCGVRHQLNQMGMYKVVFQPEHRQFPI